MRWLLPLLAASMATLVLSLASSAGAERVSRGVIVDPPLHLAPRVECARPARLRLRRFEDRSARLECGGRILVRVSVPG